MEPGALCDRHDVMVVRVGDVYDTDEQGRPLDQAEKDKWCVGVRDEDFATDLVRVIPLADTEAEAQANAVLYLDLRNRCPACRATVQRHPILPAPMWKLILFPALLIVAILVGALQLDGLIHTGFEFTAPAFVIASSLAIVGIIAMALSRKDSSGFYCRQCGYSE